MVLPMHPVTQPVRGLVLLLHDCGGSAFDFFARSEKCEECLGLSEEMRTARVVLKKGYLPLAVSSAGRRTGCWRSGEDDAARFREVLELEDLGGYHIGGYRDLSVVAIGAGRGGAFAAELALEELAEFALVIASDLADCVAEELAGRKVPMPIYYAPMPWDYSTMERVKETYVNKDNSVKFSRLSRHLDIMSCQRIPVTEDYWSSAWSG